MTTSFITNEDLEARAGRSLTEVEQLRTDALCEDVSASIIAETGQLFVRAERTWRTRVHREFVVLPQRPVHEVSAVVDLDGNDVSFTFDGIDRVYLARTCRSSVDITYEAGDDEVPAIVVGVAANIVLRALGVDPIADGAVVQESIDGYSHTLGSASGSGAYGLLPREAEILSGFGFRGGSFTVAT